MDDEDPREQILRLEVQIEELAEAVERCRKTIQISKVAIALGGDGEAVRSHPDPA